MKLKKSGIPVFGYERRKSIRRESFAEHFGQECQPNVLEQLLSRLLVHGHRLLGRGSQQHVD